MAKKCEICKEQPISKKWFNAKTCEDLDCRAEWTIAIKEKQREKEKPKYSIPKKSEKRKIDEIIYQSERVKFLMLPENKTCPITKKPTTDVHHKKGRNGSLYLDKRYWIALSREGHKFVEENPEWAKENGYSLNRLSND